MARKYLLALIVTGACGSSGATSRPAVATGSGEAERAAEAARVERARRATLATAHNARLDEQATALAGTCARPAEAAATRCTPSCYAAEPVDVRAGKPLRGAVAIPHLVCTRDPGGAGPFLLLDELGGAKLVATRVRGRWPRPARRGWQAAVQAEVEHALAPELARGDVIVVKGRWTATTHPASGESLRCVIATRYTRAVTRPLDACGSHGKVACEAAGNAAAHGLNLVHFRIAEALRLQASGNQEGCQQAALDALATARGMPRWRQYMTLNVDRWKASPRYRTRFDGMLEEDALFARAIELGTRAESLYVACGGAANPRTTPAHEQAFHTCR